MKNIHYTLSILLFTVISFSFATGEKSNYQGIDKITHNWHKLVHHKTKLMRAECKNEQEFITVVEKEGKYFLTHTTATSKAEYEILSSISRTENKEDILELELLNTNTQVQKHAKVKVSMSQSIWFGLTSNTSTDVFIQDEIKQHFEPKKGDCK